MLYSQLITELDAIESEKSSKPNAQETPASLTEKKQALLARIQAVKDKRAQISGARAVVANELYETNRCSSLVERHLNAHFHAQSKLNDEMDSGDDSDRSISRLNMIDVLT